MIFKNIKFGDSCNVDRTGETITKIQPISIDKKSYNAIDKYGNIIFLREDEAVSIYEDFNTYCKNFILDHIYDYEGGTFYACDLGYEITQGINVDGSATYSTYEAMQYIKTWWNKAADFCEYCKDNFGEIICNPFDEPEKFHVCMIIEGVNSILAQCSYIDDHWDDEIKLDAGAIEKIIGEMGTAEACF